MVIPKPKQIVRSKAVLDSVAHLPRRHLGHAIYHTTLKPGDPPSLLHTANAHRGFASTPNPLPRFEGRENCTFTIRVPRVHLTPQSREEITSRRALWGTDVYSDDSDIIAACIHGGWVRGEWPEDIDVSLLGLEIESPEAEKNDAAVNGFSREEGHLMVNGKSEKDIVLNEPPLKGPMTPPANCDLHVTILILPALEKYSSSVRWGIMSREWEATHDGLSFMILSIKWVHGVDTAKEASGKGRRMRMKQAFDNEEVDEETSSSRSLENGNGYDHVTSNGEFRESFVRVEGRGPLAEITGLGMGSWWKRQEKNKSKSIEKEVEVKMEDRPDDDLPQGKAIVVS